MSSDRPDKRLWPRRVGWLVLIWIASVGVLAIIAVLFRLVMNMAGLTV